MQPTSTTSPAGRPGADPSAPRETPGAQTPARSGSSVGTVLLSAILSVVCGGVGAYAYLRYAPDDKVQPPRSSTAATSPAGSKKSVATTETAASGTEKSDAVEQFNRRLDAVTEHLEAVEKQVKEIPHTDISTDLANLQIKVADLSKAADELNRVPKDLSRMNDQLDTVNGQVRSIRGDLDAIQSRLERSGVRVRTSVSNAAAPAGNTETSRRDAAKPVVTEAYASDAVLSRGSDLFKSRRYKEASDLFESLELTHPDDARVWYYAALTHGFATGNWTNGTVRLVEKGIERERAGTPKASTIDASFKDLTTATGKEWLASYRERAKTSDHSELKR